MEWNIQFKKCKEVNEEKNWCMLENLRVSFLEEEDLKLGLEAGSCTMFASEPLRWTSSS